MNILNSVFPFIELKKKMKKVNNKIDSLNKNPEKYSFEYASQYSECEKTILESTLENTLNIKKSLEDKAKSSLIAITIAVTLVFNIIQIIQKGNIINIVVLSVLGTISLIYLIASGIFSLYSISNVNQVFFFFPKHYLLSEEEQKEQLALYIELNYLNNTKRNNLMYASYRCMMVSIVLLIFIFIVSSVTFLNVSDRNINAEKQILAIEQKIELLENTNSNLLSNQKSLSDEISSISNQLNLALIDLDALNNNKKIEQKISDIYYRLEDINKNLSHLILVNPE